MGYSVKREGYVKATELLTALATDMAANGFDIEYLNGAAGAASPSGETTSVCLAPTTSVDPLVDDQPWRVFIEANTSVSSDYSFKSGHLNWLRVYVVTPNQLIPQDNGEWRIALKDFNDSSRTNSGRTTINRVQRPAGMLSYGSLKYSEVGASGDGNTTNTQTNGYFYCFNDASMDNTASETSSINYISQPNWGKRGDFAAHPLSYRLTISDHGIVFAMWGEAYDSGGMESAWFCTQRMVDKDTGAIVEDGKSPLFTVFSLEGNKDSNLDDANADQIMYMVTRESDINTPTYPRSAVIDQADSNRIINAVQQVSISEDEKFIVNFPNGLNTQRYGYPHELDLIGYTSADAVSQDNQIEMTFYGESNARKYAGLASNNQFNKGMRIVVQVEGAGIDIARS